MVHVISRLLPQTTLIKSWRVGALIIVVLWLLAGCATQKSTHATVPGEATPAATGEVAVERDNNNNVVVQLDVEHFPPPELLANDLTTYVVWVRPQGQESYQNMGQLQIGEDRSAKTSFITPYDRFDLIVTAEASSRETSPSEHVIIQSRVSEGEVMEQSGTGGGPDEEDEPVEDNSDENRNSDDEGADER